MLLRLLGLELKLASLAATLPAFYVFAITLYLLDFILIVFGEEPRL